MQIKSSAVLIAGDALATVDPSTGLGGNEAIASSYVFYDFLNDLAYQIPVDDLLKRYEMQMTTRVISNHFKSIQKRDTYSSRIEVDQIESE